MLPLNDRGNRYSLQGIRVELLTVQQHQPRRARPSDRSPSLQLRGTGRPLRPGMSRTWPTADFARVRGSNPLSSKLTRLAGEDAVLGGHLLVCGVQLARNGFDHVPAGGGQTPVVRHQPAGPGDEQAAALLSQYQPTNLRWCSSRSLSAEREADSGYPPAISHILWSYDISTRTT